MGGLVDLHCHILPGVDDGPATMEESVALVRGLEGLGFTRLVATPHDRPPRWAQDPTRLATVVAELRDALGDGAPEIDLAAENFLDDMAWQRFEAETLIRYPGGKAALFEFAVGRDPLPLGHAERLFQLRVRGVRPVLAHPERYEQVAHDVGALEKLTQGGTLLLMSLVSLGAGLLHPARRAAAGLVRAGVVAAAASDAHSVKDLKGVARGLERLRSLAGDEGFDAMMRQVPEGLLRAGGPRGR